MNDDVVPEDFDDYEYYCEADELGYDCMYPNCDCDLYILTAEDLEMEEYEEGEL